MLQVHHLNNSRSQRILWLLEELALPYEVVAHERDPATMRAPASVKAVHPLGKLPVVLDGGLTIAESGAIVEYLLSRYGHGRLAPAPGTAEHVAYLQWLHFAEGSGMPLVVLLLYLGRMPGVPEPVTAAVRAQLADALAYADGRLGASPYFAGAELSAADVQMTFFLQAATVYLRSADQYLRVGEFLGEMTARPAYQRAIERGGPFELGR